MIVSALFVVLAALAIAGASGLLFIRCVDRCLLSFLLCAAALAGFYLLLNLQFIAAVQLALSAGLLGVLLAASLRLDHSRSGGAPQDTASSGPPGEPGPSTASHLRWGLLAAGPFVAVACWGIATGTIGEPILTSPPVWAVRGDYIPALGQEITTSYLIPFSLLGLLLLVCVVSAAYLSRQDKR